MAAAYTHLGGALQHLAPNPELVLHHVTQQSMTTHVTSTPPLATPRTGWSPPKWELALLAIGCLAMFVPTYVELDRTVWNVVGQGHGPVMLMLALWLAWQRLPLLTALPEAGSPFIGYIAFAFGLVLYVIGRSQDILMLDSTAQIFILAGLLALYKGAKGLQVMWFPLFFMIFIVPLPGFLVAALTGPLKAGVSYVAEMILHALHYPIGRSGVTITIGQYQLLVADACAGLNSIFALEAIGVFYLSVVNHVNKWRNWMLALLIIPISFVSNVLRVIALVLVTYYFGDEVGQGFVHDFAGILLFMVATLLTIGTDAVLGLFFKETKQGRST